jgi:hypothetical protein
LDNLKFTSKYVVSNIGFGDEGSINASDGNKRICVKKYMKTRSGSEYNVGYRAPFDYGPIRTIAGMAAAAAAAKLGSMFYQGRIQGAHSYRVGGPGGPKGPSSSSAGRFVLAPKGKGAKKVKYPKKEGLLVDERGRPVRRAKAKGALMSKSRGFFSPGKRVIGPLDYFSREGVVTSRELGSSVTGTSINRFQSVWIGHAVFSKPQLQHDIGLALAKLTAKMMRRQILDFDNTVVEAATETGTPQFTAVLEYKQFATGTTLNTTFNMTSATTWASLAGWFETSLTLANNQTGFYFTRLFVTQRDHAAANNFYQIFQLDLTKAKVQLYCKSSMKIQNRTSAAGFTGGTADNDADAVDNVPIYGKIYSGTGNYVQVQDDVYNAQNSGDVNVLAAGVVAGPLREPLPLSMVKRASQIAKAHLDPGEIKTSVLTYRKTFTLMYLVRECAASGGESASPLTRGIISIGKFRFFSLEKMIQSVATNDNNGLNVAYEVDQKHGCICSAPMVRQSNYVLFQTPV